MHSSKKVIGKGEVACKDCGLDPLCSVLDYAEDGSNVPEGILLRRRQVARGETLFHKDDPFRSIFAVKSGSFKTYVAKSANEKQVVGFHLIGELIGAEGLSGQRYPYTARALEESQVCELRFERISDSNRDKEILQEGIIRMLSAAVSFNHSLIAPLVHQSAEQRIAGFLLNISQRLVKGGMARLEFQIGMSRSDIGSYLGLASETVSRVLTRLQKTGYIELRHKRLKIVDYTALEQVADH